MDDVWYVIDLLKEELDPKIFKLNHVLISLKNNSNIDELISPYSIHINSKYFESNIKVPYLLSNQEHKISDVLKKKLVNYGKISEYPDINK